MKLAVRLALSVAALSCGSRLTLLAQTTPPPALPAWESNSNGRAPELELVMEYACATCSDDGTPGSIPFIRSLAVGPGSFAVLFQKAPRLQVVRVWDLDAGGITQFHATPDTSVRSSTSSARSSSSWGK